MSASNLHNEKGESTYSIGAAGRLTGLSEHVLRAWERRHAAVTPLRSERGTRRYREADILRLRLLAEGVRAGHAIGTLADLSDAELRERVAKPEPPEHRGLEAALAAIERLDVAEAEHILSIQLSTLGPALFARSFARSLLEALGQGVQSERYCIASEHLASSILRSLLGGALRSKPLQRPRLPILFATPEGEHHELGLMIAALIAQDAGAQSICLGTELPAHEIARAVHLTAARAVILSVSGLSPQEAEPALAAIDQALPQNIAVWIGGAQAAELELPDRFEYLERFEQLDDKVALLLEAKFALLNSRL